MSPWCYALYRESWWPRWLDSPRVHPCIVKIGSNYRASGKDSLMIFDSQNRPFRRTQGRRLLKALTACVERPPLVAPTGFESQNSSGLVPCPQHWSPAPRAPAEAGSYVTRPNRPREGPGQPHCRRELPLPTRSKPKVTHRSPPGATKERLAQSSTPHEDRRLVPAPNEL